jgi:quercetin dioxygenase-like cupin family protein
MDTRVNRQFVYDLRTMPKKNVLGDLSTSHGASFTGDRIYVALITKSAGTGSTKPHYHPDETFNYVLQGSLQVSMDGQDFVVPEGSLLHIPSNMPHTSIAGKEKDAVVLIWRDATSEKAGRPTTIES